MRKFGRVALILGLTLLSATWGLAQPGSLQGRVIDSSGAAVPNTQITLTSGTGAKFETRSTADGSYRFASIDPGAYVLDASARDLKLDAPRELSLGRAPISLDLRLRV